MPNVIYSLDATSLALSYDSLIYRLNTESYGTGILKERAPVDIFTIHDFFGVIADNASRIYNNTC